MSPLPPKTNKTGLWKSLAAVWLLSSPELMTPIVLTLLFHILSSASTPPHENPATMILLPSIFAYEPVPAVLAAQSTAFPILVASEVPPPEGAPSAMARKP